MNRLIVFLFVLPLLGACATVPMANPEQDEAARNYQVQPKESVIYLYRNESMGAAVTVGIRLDGKRIAQTAKDVYFMWKVAPGQHKLTCEAETSRDLEVTTLPGKATYVWQEMKMGIITARCQLHEVPEAEAKKDMEECKLAR